MMLLKSSLSVLKNLGSKCKNQLSKKEMGVLSEVSIELV